MAVLAPSPRRASPALVWLGGLACALVALGLFTRYGIGGNLSRDESIYAYGGQQLVGGVPPYASIFDPKTPLATMLCGVAVAAGRLIGAGDLDAIRVLFLVLSIATVVGVYGLVVVLWDSPVGGILAAVVFASFRGFAVDALAGPDAKTPGILLGVLAMILLVRRRWFAGAFAGALAFLVWQPLAVYPLLAIVAAALGAPAGARRGALGRAVAGTVIPLVATTLYFWLAGALHKFLEAAFVFPLTGVKRAPETVTQRIEHIFSVVDLNYGNTRVLFWGGLALLLALGAGRFLTARVRDAVADPFVCVVVASLSGLALYSATDFQGYPDVYPLLPYAAIGIGGTVAVTLAALRNPAARRVGLALALGAACVLAGLSAYWYETDPVSLGPSLAKQRARAALVAAAVGPRTVYALGNPVPVVLMGRRNPSRFIYLSSGVGRYVVKHTRGGLSGWEREIRRSRPAAIVVGDVNSSALLKLMTRLRLRYPVAYVGHWTVFVDPALRATARAHGLVVN